MTRAGSYQALAQLIDYPRQKEELLACLESVADELGSRGSAAPCAPFADFLADTTLSLLQEEYVACFDFNPVRAPYLGHHLYGDQRKRAAYMIGLKQEFARHGFAPRGCELPDHLPVLLRFLAHLSQAGEAEFRRAFIAEQVLPGVIKLGSGGEQGRWLSLFRTAEILLSTDCKEAAPC